MVAVIAAMACAGSAACQAQDLLKPDETFLFAERDSMGLYMDVYYPADGSEMTVDGVNKPTILYVFGGGFKAGRKDTPTAREWFRLLTDEGFTVAAIDYRLGLKEVDGMGNINDIYNAIQIAVEDLFSSILFLRDGRHRHVSPVSGVSCLCGENRAGSGVYRARGIRARVALLGSGNPAGHRSFPPGTQVINGVPHGGKGQNFGGKSAVRYGQNPYRYDKIN